MINIIKKLSDEINKKRVNQYLFFMIASILTVLFMGYYFGTFDQVVHIPSLKKLADPTLYPDDKYLELSKYHYSYFWYFFVPFYRLHILEISMFITHLITVYLTYYALYKLSKTLFNSPLASFFSTVVFIIPHIGFAGFPVFEFSLLNRTFVLPFLLLAIDFYLNKKLALSFIILGIMYNFHVVSVNFVLAIFFFDLFLRIKFINVKKTLYSLLSFAVTASPVLIWKFSNSGVDTKLNWEWFNIINKGILYHIFTLVTINPSVLFLVLSGASLYFIFFFALKYSKSPHNPTVVNFVYASLIILSVQILATAFFPLTIIIQSQIIRVGIFVLIFAYIYFANFLSSEVFKSNRNYDLKVMFGGFFLSLTPIILVIAIIARNLIRSRLIFFISKLLLIMGFIGLLIMVYMINIWKPGIHIYPPHDELYDVEIWARENTPKDAVFITPPNLWWLYNIEWRVISERSTVVTMSDLLETAFVPDYIKYWKPRFESVAPGAINQFNGDIIKNFKTASKAFDSLKEEDFMSISNEYSAQYLVVEKKNKLNFQKVFSNDKYVVYLLFLDK